MIKNIRKTFLSVLSVMHSFLGSSRPKASFQLLTVCSFLRDVIQAQDSIVAYSGDLHSIYICRSYLFCELRNHSSAA